jgi:Ribbon-helix-helix domain
MQIFLLANRRRKSEMANARSGLRKGDLSKFVEDAVQWRLMKLNIAEARARNAHLRPEEIEARRLAR